MSSLLLLYKQGKHSPPGPSDYRITEDDDERITEDGQQRQTEGA